MTARKTKPRATGPGKPALCEPRQLPEGLAEVAARMAAKLNPANAPRTDELDYVPSPARLALLTTKYWGAGGVELATSFTGTVAAALKERILGHMNAWSEFCSVRFVLTAGVGRVRVSLGRGGYWSYLGTDVDFIAKDQPTMNLEGFTLDTPEAEYRRVVRHEAGHTLGFPHEHLRKGLVALLDPAKTVAYFRRTQGWSEAVTRAQVLTPLEESSLLGTEVADMTSIMCYQLPGEVTRTGKPIVGGADIDADDREFASRVYPPPAPPPPPPPAPPPDQITLAAEGTFRAKQRGGMVTFILE